MKNIVKAAALICATSLFSLSVQAQLMEGGLGGTGNGNGLIANGGGSGHRVTCLHEYGPNPHYDDWRTTTRDGDDTLAAVETCNANGGTAFISGI